MSITAEQIAELRRLLGHLDALTDGRPWERQTTTNRLLEAIPALLDAAEEAERLRAELHATKTVEFSKRIEAVTATFKKRAIAAESALTAANERVRVLEEECGPLIRSCADEFLGQDSLGKPDDEPVGHGDDGPLYITFGEVRRARAALTDTPFSTKDFETACDNAAKRVAEWSPEKREAMQAAARRFAGTTPEGSEP